MDFDLQAGVDHYCVMGNPVAHSLSPRIHHAFAAQTEQAIEYRAVLVPTDAFEDALAAFRDAGGRGANITLPFKEAAWRAADRRTARAERAGAVNTIGFADGEVRGDNTDGIGLVRDLRDNLGCPLAGRALLILGAGGAVRGVIDPLFDAGADRIVIANRTVERARAIAARFADRGDISAVGYDELGEGFPVVINATSLSLRGEVPPLPDTVLAGQALAYDMVYQSAATAFMRWAAEHGAGTTADGLGMLVEQAAESFHGWRGVRPATAPVIAKLRG